MPIQKQRFKFINNTLKIFNTLNFAIITNLLHNLTSTLFIVIRVFNEYFLEVAMHKTILIEISQDYQMYLISY